MKTKLWNGHLWFAVPPRRESPLSGVLRRIEQARVFKGAFKVASVVLGSPRRRAPAWRPAVVHIAPRSTPRPRERGARMVAASGRDGTGERDDGSGGDSGAGAGGGGDGPGPAPAPDDPGGAA
jgi:hypothetical protein